MAEPQHEREGWSTDNREDTEPTTPFGQGPTAEQLAHWQGPQPKGTPEFNLCDPTQARGFAAWFPEPYRTGENTMKTKHATTLRFRAENFEAVATEVPGTVFENWVVAVGGQPGHSLQVETYGVPGLWCQHAVKVWNKVGWTELARRRVEGPMQPSEHALALAISLLYSVPGVEVVE